MAHPGKLNQEIQEAICKSIRAGAYVETAAAYAGIDKVTFYRWLKRGARGTRGRYVDFRNAVDKAMAEAEMRDLLLIDRAAQKGAWQAAAWKLERRNPKHWARRQFEGHLDAEGKPTDPPKQPDRVLVVPADIEDIYEWSRLATAEMEKSQAAPDEQQRSSTDVPS